MRFERNREIREVYNNGMGNDVILRVEGMNKSFTSTKAIVDVTMEVKYGEICGLIGENGSGKSTLASMITGSLKPDSGTMYFEGQPYAPSSMIESKSHGISILVQEMGTINGLSVAENIFLGKEGIFSKVGNVSKARLIKESRKVLAEIGVDYINPTAMIDTVSFEERKIIEVAMAMYSNPKLLIVDETTTALSQKGREKVYEIMQDMKKQGNSIIFISHDLEELERICDTVTILRDGHYIDTLAKEDITAENMRNLMIGRELSGHYYREDTEGTWDDEVVLKVENVTLGRTITDVSFDLHKGEILGLGGLTECGMHELCKVIFGAYKPDKGQVVATKNNRVIKHPWDAIKEKIAYLPKDRDQESIFLGTSIKDNIVMMSLDDLQKGGFISRRSEKKLAQKYADKLAVKMQGIEQLVKDLSGGNKQKVVVAKWLANESEILIMDCPTRGIDVGVKAAIYSLMEELKKEGKAIIMVSEEMPELIGMSDRIIILKDGHMTAELVRGPEVDERAIIGHMI